MTNAKDAETRKDDLRTGKPYWLTTRGISVPHRADPGRDRFDVVVVGAGISGALTAEALTQQGRKVLILDRRSPVSGSTPASTAMIQHEIDVPLTELQAQRGARAANAAWRRSVAAVNDLVELVERLKINCQMQRKPALYLAGNQMDGDNLAAEVEARRKIGIKASLIDRARLRSVYSISRAAAILSPDSASANPAQLTAGLLRACKARGALIAAPVEVTDMAELPGGVALATSDGRVLTADHAVFCTGYEFLPQMQTKSHHVTSTWALATGKVKHIPSWLKDTIVWEASDPYLYFRSDPSGRIIAGGEDEDASERNSDPKLLARKSRTILAKLEKLTGLAVGPAEFAWSAPFSVTDDGLPIIDRVKGHDRVWAVMGFGGNGITFSMIAAQIVSAGIAGEKDPDAGLFRLR
ncbi:NAD(P)/FAD-dependent oxidoreductase [Paracoccus zhejiangensis]|uniref:FAD-dependent oxidoreductase n=1 Tax=Paracoccus zhejiangensis TaxID=1077935 RepID=A0A2H5F5W7_9RHOB|nr:FAD-dependent oxidoreductase [Paracoccus zhejiangensis]AUH66924.1 FAD-dependent oxidoreductase [Paracoccus zhejiangensis]